MGRQCKNASGRPILSYDIMTLTHKVSVSQALSLSNAHIHSC